ncbi:MAG: hypothetical protein K2H85_04880, partial [Allobaculum sp.]|nr:hypothetical protein [Allobaculum sp.]
RVYLKNNDRAYGNFPNMWFDDCSIMLNCLPGYNKKIFGILGTGIFYNLFEVNRLEDPNQRSAWPILYPSYDSYGKKIYFGREIPSIIDPHRYKNIHEYTWQVLAFIPKEDIGKYSKFWIESTNK